MKKPILVVMAAGMGSRYGGLKQIDPVGKNGEIIMDFSIYDALKAGFSKVIFIIKEELLDDFKSVVGDRVSKYIPVEYVFQKLTAARRLRRSVNSSKIPKPTAIKHTGRWSAITSKTH